MKSFKDKSGRLWEISITIGSALRVKGNCGVELMDAEDIDQAENFMLDPEMFRDVVFNCLIDGQRNSREIFNWALSEGDLIFKAASAFLDELVEFFPLDEKKEKTDEPEIKGPDLDTWDFIWQTAGILGVNPLPLTLRQLVSMSEGFGKERWNRAGSILAMLFNCNRDPKKASAKSADDFNPYVKGNTVVEHVEWLPPKETNEILKKALGING